jgi:hypothetical protein
MIEEKKEYSLKCDKCGKRWPTTRFHGPWLESRDELITKARDDGWDASYVDDAALCEEHAVNEAEHGPT